MEVSKCGQGQAFWVTTPDSALQPELGVPKIEFQMTEPAPPSPP